MLGHGGSSAGSYLADPTFPIPSHCAVIILFQSVPVHHPSASIVVTSTLRVNIIAEECTRQGEGIDPTEIIVEAWPDEVMVLIQN